MTKQQPSPAASGIGSVAFGRQTAGATRMGYLRGRVLSQYKLNRSWCAFCNQVDTSLTEKGGSP